MLRNYWKVALRHLLKNKGYVLINTLGMGLALACCLTAYLLIAYDVEFDEYFEKEQVAHIGKVVEQLQQPDGETYEQLVAPVILAPSAANQIPVIRSYTRYCSQRGYTRWCLKSGQWSCLI